MTNDKDALNEFFSEAEEILSRLSSNFASIEKGRVTASVLDELYRDTHTLKGTSQLFGFRDLGTLTHAMESSLAPVRNKQVSPGAELLDALYKCVDAIEGFIRDAKAEPATSAFEASAWKTSLSALIDAACAQFGSRLDASRDVLFDEEILKAAGKAPGAREPAPAEKAPAPEAAAASPAEAAMQAASTDGAGDSSIRVQVGILDRLMNLVGEMVLVRNQVLQYSNRHEDLEFLNLSQRLDLVTSDLQEQVMRTRMQPIGNVVGKFQRLTRDLSRELDKQIDLTIQGKDTELDRTLLEAIKDPLTHIVRNSCDHGIETPQERKAAGKPETGHLSISAYHEGGQVVIEVSDDGKGLDRKRILAKALEKGLIPSEKASALTDREVVNLIFLPGFSTAERVSAVSGRGVGMDVVRTNIEKIGGSVDVESAEGKGTTMRLRIPLTLAIVPAMLVRFAEAVYAIPQVKLVELVRVDLGAEADSGIQMLQGKPVYELRGKILPLVDLREVLGARQEGARPQSTMNIVVLNAEGENFGLVVQEVLDTADIVVKPLSKFLKSLGLYSAATILGNGNVALILDPSGIAKAAGLSTKAKKQEGAFAEAATLSASSASESQEFLLFHTSGRGKYALPLCLVNRLEEFRGDQVEFSGRQPIVRYRGAILPLIDVDSVLGFREGGSIEASALLPTVVVQRSGKLVGIAVKSILDVATVDGAVDDSVKDRFGILGNLILGQEVVTVLDTMAVVDHEISKLADGESALAPPKGPSLEARFNRKPRILYAEDVAFFRRQVAQVLASKGYEVITADDGKAALDLLSRGGPAGYDLVLSDIEMPKMNGYDLARSIRGDSRLGKIPLIALTTRFTKADVDKGLQAGFDRYLEKLNPDVLLEAVRELLDAGPAAGAASEERTVA